MKSSSQATVKPSVLAKLRRSSRWQLFKWSTTAATARICWSARNSSFCWWACAWLTSHSKARANTNKFLALRDLCWNIHEEIKTHFVIVCKFENKNKKIKIFKLNAAWRPSLLTRMWHHFSTFFLSLFEHLRVQMCFVENIKLNADKSRRSMETSELSLSW